MSLLLLFAGAQTISIPPSGTGGWGARLNAEIAPLSSRKKRKVPEEDNRRRKSLEALEAAINAAVEKIEGIAERPTATAQIIVPEVVQALPVIDWDEIEHNRQLFVETEQRLQSVLLELKAYEVRLERLAQEQDDEDVELLLLM